MSRTLQPLDSATTPQSIALTAWARWDAVTLLSVFLILRLALPSQLVVGPLGGAGAPATLFSLALLSYWLWHRLHRVECRRGAAVNTAALIFGWVLLASYAVAALRPIEEQEFRVSMLAFISAVGWLGGLLLASDGVTTFNRLKVLVRRLASLGGAFAGLGLLQFLTRTTWVDELSIPGLVINTPVYPGIDREGFFRPFSTAIHPIEFGSVIAMLLPLAIVSGLMGPTREGAQRWPLWIPAALLLLVSALSSTRSTMIGVAIGLTLLWPALKHSQRLAATVVFIGLSAGLFVTVPGLAGTVLGLFRGITSPDSSVISRIDSFAVASTYIDRAPFFGRGLGTFMPQYRIFDNQYLLALVEIGIVGFVALGLLWVVPVVGVARHVRTSAPGSPERLVGVGLLAACVVGAAGLALFDGFGFPMMPGVWFVLLGLAGAYTRLERTNSS